MAESILVPVDGSSPSRSALEYAVGRFPDAAVTLLYVMDPMVDFSRRQAYPGYTGDDEFVNEREKAEHVLDSMLDTVPEGVSVTTEIAGGDPARTILQYADDHRIDGIVIGRHGREGPVRVLLGSVADAVVRRASVPVTVVRPE